MRSQIPRIIALLAVFALLVSASSLAAAAVDGDGPTSIVADKGDKDKKEKAEKANAKKVAEAEAKAESSEVKAEAKEEKSEAKAEAKEDKGGAGAKEAKANKKGGGTCTGEPGGWDWYWRYTDGHIDQCVGWTGGNDVYKTDYPSLHVNMLHNSCSDTINPDGTVKKGDLAGHRVAEWRITKNGKLCGEFRADEEPAPDEEEEEQADVFREEVVCEDDVWMKRTYKNDVLQSESSTGIDCSEPDTETRTVIIRETETTVIREEIICVDNVWMERTYRDGELQDEDSTGIPCTVVAGSQTTVDLVCVDNVFMERTYRDGALTGEDSTGVACNTPVLGVQQGPAAGPSPINIAQLPSTSTGPGTSQAGIALAGMASTLAGLLLLRRRAASTATER